MTILLVTTKNSAIRRSFADFESSIDEGCATIGIGVSKEKILVRFFTPCIFHFIDHLIPIHEIEFLNRAIPYHLP